MESLLEIRNKWDELFKQEYVQFAMKGLGAVIAYFAVSSMLGIAPFAALIGVEMKVLIPIIVAAIWIASESAAIIVFGLIMMIALSGGQSAAAMLAGFACFISCTNPRIVCILTMLTPLCIMGITKVDDGNSAVTLTYFIFFIAVYFNSKLGNSFWKYIQPVYFTLLAYSLKFYCVPIGHVSKPWPENAYVKSGNNVFNMFDTYSGFSKDLALLDITTLIVLVIVNIIICFVIYKLIMIKNIKFLNLQVDIKELIIFAVSALMMIIAMIVLSRVIDNSFDYSFIGIIIQAILAYIVTRPFASYKICERLKKDTDDTNAVYNMKTYGLDYSKSLKVEVENVLETYLNGTLFESIIRSERKPINSILIFGKKDIDKKYIVKNLLDKTGLDTRYQEGDAIFEEYLKNKKIIDLEDIGNTKFSIIVINNIEALANIDNSEMKKSLISYLKGSISQHVFSNKVLFILTTSNIESVPEEFFENGIIDKCLYGGKNDSMLLNKTYRLVKAIGKGGGGIVYKAYHERLDVTVVVKQIINKTAGKRSYKAEAEVLKKIKHMYLPKVYDVFEENGEFYTVMDYVPGKSLQEKCDENGCFDQSSVLKWTKQLVEAVDYLHNQNPPIIHSDIKPGNVMLTPEGDISLIDFNISTLFDKNSTNGMGVTPGYSPIEQYGNVNNYYKMLAKKGIKPAEMEGAASNVETVVLEELNSSDNSCEGIDAVKDNVPIVSKSELTALAQKGLSEKTDIFSIGATMYALLTGEKPSEDFNRRKSLKDFDVHLSEAVIEVIDKAMNVDPDKRYPNVKTLQQDLEKIIL